MSGIPLTSDLRARFLKLSNAIVHFVRARGGLGCLADEARGRLLQSSTNDLLLSIEAVQLAIFQGGLQTFAAVYI